MVEINPDRMDLDSITDSIINNSILLSIKSVYAKDIYAGTKKYEYRKRVYTNNNNNKNIQYIILYETSPVSKVTGMVSIWGILQGTAKDIWDTTCVYSGIEYDKYMKYFNNDLSTKAYAYVLGSVAKYTNPYTLEEFSEMLGLNKVLKAPQSFVYIRD